MCDKPAGSKLKAIMQQKCPRCRRGKVFTHRFYQLRHFSDMHPDCPVCGHHFEIEPGYFYSAMYISYMITSALCILTGGAVYFLLQDPDTYIYILCILATLLTVSPLSLRYSRMLTMHLITYVKFDDKWK